MIILGGADQLQEYENLSSFPNKNTLVAPPSILNFKLLQKMIQASYDINFFSSESWDVDFLNSDDRGTAGGLTEREFEFEDANSNWRCNHCSCQITYLFKNWSRNPMTLFSLQWKLTCYRFRPNDRGTSYVSIVLLCGNFIQVQVIQNGNIYLTRVRHGNVIRFLYLFQSLRLQ